MLAMLSVATFSGYVSASQPIPLGNSAPEALQVGAAAISPGVSQNSGSDSVLLITPKWQGKSSSVGFADSPAPALGPAMAPRSPISNALGSHAIPVVKRSYDASSSSAPSDQYAPTVTQSWTAAEGSTLQKTVMEWAAKEHYKVLWEATDLDYPIVSALTFRGGFEDAVSQVFGLYDKAERSFVVQGWRNQRLMKITERSKIDSKQAGTAQ
jgi:type IV pili sensor histidine kinase/response regulator